jgi:hypothetical protein
MTTNRENLGKLERETGPAAVSAGVSPVAASSQLILLTCVGVSASGYDGGGR